MAEFVMKKMVADEGLENKISVDSAATSTEEIGNGMHRGTLRKLQEKNIPYSNHRARQITTEDYNKYDFLIGMDSENMYYMGRRWPEDPEKKIYMLLEFAGSRREVADPWYTGNFDETYYDINEGCSALMKILKKKVAEGN